MSSHDHSGMDHSSMDHSKMDHSGMDNSQMGHHNPHMMSKGSGGDDMNMTMSMGEHNMMMGEHSMMKMYFHFSYIGEIVLFEQWKLTNIGVLVGSMIGLFLLAMLYEGLKYYREHLLHKAFKRSPDNTMNENDNTDRGMLNDSSTTPLQKKASCHHPVDNSCPADDEVAYGPTTSNNKDKNSPYYLIKPYMTTMFNQVHVFQTLLHLVQIIISYLLMLVFMTYNVWLCIAVALGATTGYFIFGWRKTVVVDITEHCH